MHHCISCCIHRHVQPDGMGQLLEEGGADDGESEESIKRREAREQLGFRRLNCRSSSFANLAISSSFTMGKCAIALREKECE